MYIWTGGAYVFVCISYEREKGEREETKSGKIKINYKNIWLKDVEISQSQNRILIFVLLLL